MTFAGQLPAKPAATQFPVLWFNALHTLAIAFPPYFIVPFPLYRHWSKARNVARESPDVLASNPGFGKRLISLTAMNAANSTISFYVDWMLMQAAMPLAKRRSVQLTTVDFEALVTSAC
ncbi:MULTISPECIES: hypothetical protein [Silvimonas]|uniref:hypothetical protein n=1 Tax=Silvimonas TaxID=300264 RepID=UPI0024B3862E|nr:MULTISPECIES: hypothetical protein [Silvimonas]MDR3427719.1 hypothetical protein [Silvimonas sp.]